MNSCPRRLVNTRRSKAGGGEVCAVSVFSRKMWLNVNDVDNSVLQPRKLLDPLTSATQQFAFYDFTYQCVC